MAEMDVAHLKALTQSIAPMRVGDVFIVEMDEARLRALMFLPAFIHHL